MSDYPCFKPSKRKHKPSADRYTDKRQVYWYTTSASGYAIYATRASGDTIYHDLLATRKTEEDAKKLVDLLIWGL